MLSSRSKSNLSSKLFDDDYIDDSFIDKETIKDKNKEKYSKHRPSYFTPKIKFTEEEDTLLLNAVQKLGSGNWHVIANHVPGRNARQCRERWNNYVNPSLISSPWTSEEDQFLLEKYQELGPHWHTIASFFTSRSTNNIKNRFTILQRRQKRKGNRKNNNQKLPSRNATYKPRNVSTNIVTEAENNISNLESIKISKSDSEANTENNVDKDIIFSDQDNGTKEKLENNKNKETKDPFQFLEILKDFDEIVWSNDFDPLSSSWFDINYF